MTAAVRRVRRHSTNIGETVTDTAAAWTARLEPTLRPVARKARALVRSAVPGLTEYVHYGVLKYGGSTAMRRLVAVPLRASRSSEPRIRARPWFCSPRSQRHHRGLRSGHAPCDSANRRRHSASRAASGLTRGGTPQAGAAPQAPRRPATIVAPAPIEPDSRSPDRGEHDPRRVRPRACGPR